MTAWSGLRYRPDTGWELRCESCAKQEVEAYWPLTLEFWNPDKGMTRCRACWNAYERGRRRRLLRARVVSQHIRDYKREWSARKRRQQREDEGRQRYERRKAA